MRALSFSVGMLLFGVPLLPFGSFYGNQVGYTNPILQRSKVNANGWLTVFQDTPDLGFPVQLCCSGLGVPVGNNNEGICQFSRLLLLTRQALCQARFMRYPLNKLTEQVVFLSPFWRLWSQFHHAPVSLGKSCISTLGKSCISTLSLRQYLPRKVLVTRNK